MSVIKRTCGSIYALVIASLMAPAIALALMAGRVLAEEPQWPDLKPLFDFLDMLDRSWLGTALKNYDHDPKSWNGVWPNSSMVIYSEPGGVIKEHVERWQELARSGADIEILGPSTMANGVRSLLTTRICAPLAFCRLGSAPRLVVTGLQYPNPGQSTCMHGDGSLM
jgi:hypothetical protein